jgi:hypothetical protein
MGMLRWLGYWWVTRGTDRELGHLSEWSLRYWVLRLERERC